MLGQPEEGILAMDRRQIPRLLRRCAARSPLTTLVRLFWLNTAVEEDAVREAIAPTDVAARVELGLLQRGGEGTLTAPVRIATIDDLLLVTESLATSVSPYHQVMRVSGSTLDLGRPMIPCPAGAVLDLGTGNGILALLAGARGATVIGVDCNPRAVNFATFSALLNRLPKVSFRLGDLFVPVAGMDFDLIVANPPYVISPERQALYRDSGRPADGICEHIVRSAPSFLRPGGSPRC
jgi:SAM-dependent methyltransferase